MVRISMIFYGWFNCVIYRRYFIRDYSVEGHEDSIPVERKEGGG
jgi:hypothetical protein